MERTLGLQHEAEMTYLENQASTYYSRRWQSLEQEAHLEYNRARTLTLEEVSRFESNLVNRFTQGEQLAYNAGRNEGVTQLTMMRTELDQSRRQAGLQQLNLRNELAAAHPPQQIPPDPTEATAEVRAMQARNSQLTHELTQANLRVLQHEEASQNPPPPVAGQEGEQDAALRNELATMSEHLAAARRSRVSQAHETYQRVTNLERSEAGLRETEIM
eukprot:1472719-Amphidinium_carterae.1